MRTTPLSMGEPAPWFHCRTAFRERFVFDTVAGRYLVLAFFGSAVTPHAASLLRRVMAERARFDDTNLSFFGVSTDPEDERQQRVADAFPGIRFFWDFDRVVSAEYGALQADGSTVRPILYVLDPALRVVAFMAARDGQSFDLPAFFGLLDRLPRIAPPHPAQPQAPILVLPRIFETSLCEALIAYYEARGGEDSGFMRDVDGRTRHVLDYAHKRRRDRAIEDEGLQRACMARIHDRLVPEVLKAFQFHATRIERYIVSCYDAREEGHFRAHRDNTTKGTAHRRFAVSLFLNTGAYEGGHLRFPEYGSALYSAPVGGAVVFSCSLLHEATTVTKGRRYMFVPFLYDESARAVRDSNAQFLDLKDPEA